MKSRIIFLLSLMITMSWMHLTNASAEEIKNFTTDGCTLSPDGTPADPDKWCECCVEHDKLYWQGGTYNDRLNADIALGKCVAVESGSTALGDAYFLGVRVGGSPYLNTPWRWGYGYTYGRGYKTQTSSEAADAAIKLQQFDAAHPDPCSEMFK